METQLVIPQESYFPKCPTIPILEKCKTLSLFWQIPSIKTTSASVRMHVRLSQSYQTVFTPPGIPRSSITDSSSFPNTGGLHPCETLTHAVIAATGLRCYYRLNNCQITMAACRLELTPCRRSHAKAFKKKTKDRLFCILCCCIPRWARGSLGSHDTLVMDASGVEESSQGRALGKRGCREAAVGTALTVRPPAYSYSCPGYNGWLGAKVSKTGLTRDRSQLNDHTRAARWLKQAQGRDRIPFVAHQKTKQWQFLLKASAYETDWNRPTVFNRVFFF